MVRYRRYLRLGARDVRARERELAEEIESHIEMRAEELMRRGEPAERARALAREQFGDTAAVLSSARARDERIRRRDAWSGLRRDVQLGLRHARHAPAATALTVLTYALGIGLTVAMFALVHSVLLRPLPYPDADRLVSVQGQDSLGNAIALVSYSNWADWSEQNRTLAASALHVENQLTAGTAGRARHVRAQLVTAAFFDVIGMRMAHGRHFDEADLRPGSGALIVSESFWRRDLGARTDSDLMVELGGATFNVVGVVAAGQEYPAGAELWLPLPWARREGGIFRNYINLHAVARLRPGVTVAEAEADLGAIVRRIQAAEPESDYTWAAPVVPLREHVVGEVAGYLRLLMGAVGFVLLLACANLAALNFARSAPRAGEVALRYALGGSRGAVIRQLVTEQMVLALAGGALGVLLAGWAARLVALGAADRLPRAQEISLDPRVLGFAVAVTIVAGVLAGLAPALRTSRASPGRLVGGRTSARGGAALPGGGLVACEVALAVLLLTGAGLLVRSFQAVLARDVGYQATGLATAELSLATERYRADAPRINEFWTALLASVHADPEIEHAAIANWVPTGRAGRGYLVIEGGREDPAGVGYRSVSDGYFRALGIPLLLGRTFESTDLAGGERVAVINRTLAERHWPGANPIGRQVQVPGMEGTRENAPWLTIVGVVGDVRHAGYEDDAAGNQLYITFRQAPFPLFQMSVVARARSGRDADAVRALRGAVLAWDPGLAVEPESFTARLAGGVAERRLIMSVLSGFGALALLLAAIGIYGQLAFAVAQRARELGVRAALGAQPTGLVRLVLRSALRVVVPGALAGALLAYWLTRLLEAMLVDVSRADPLTYAAATLLLAAVAALATLVPAVRAARTDPMAALRSL